METVSTAAFIGLIVIAVTQQIKTLAPKVQGVVTLIVAIVVGALVGLLDKQIGLPDITVAFGIWTAVGAVGAHTLASAVNTKSS